MVVLRKVYVLNSISRLQEADTRSIAFQIQGKLQRCAHIISIFPRHSIIRAFRCSAYIFPYIESTYTHTSRLPCVRFLAFVMSLQGNLYRTTYACSATFCMPTENVWKCRESWFLNSTALRRAWTSCVHEQIYNYNMHIVHPEAKVPCNCRGAAANCGSRRCETVADWFQIAGNFIKLRCMVQTSPMTYARVYNRNGYFIYLPRICSNIYFQNLTHDFSYFDGVHMIHFVSAPCMLCYASITRWTKTQWYHRHDMPTYIDKTSTEKHDGCWNRFCEAQNKENSAWNQNKYNCSWTLKACEAPFVVRHYCYN